MKKSKILLTMSALVALQTINIPAFATENDVTITENTMYNDYLNLSVEKDNNEGEYCRFVVKTNEGSLSTKNDNEKKIMYNNFYSSYTTININGVNYIYGEGEEIQKPVFDKETKSSISIQKFGDVEITQFLRFVNGFTDKYKDMVEISYEVNNTSKENLHIGIRVMIDAMLGNDDKGIINVNSLNSENEFEIKEKDVLNSWSISSDNKEIEAYGKSSDNTDVVPSKIQFANWDNLYDNRWDYSINYNEENEDSAIGIVWDDVDIARGEKRLFSTCYGVKNIDETPSDNEDNKQEDSSKQEDNKQKDNKQEDGSKQEDKKVNENLKNVIEQAKENADKTKTFDNNSIYFWLTCSIATLTLVIGTVLFKKKKN